MGRDQAKLGKYVSVLLRGTHRPRECLGHGRCRNWRHHPGLDLGLKEEHADVRARVCITDDEEWSFDVHARTTPCTGLLESRWICSSSTSRRTGYQVLPRANRRQGKNGEARGESRRQRMCENMHVRDCMGGRERTLVNACPLTTPRALFSSILE